MPRRMAYYDYSNPALQPQAWTVTVSTIGGLLLVVSAVLFVYILARARRAERRPRRSRSASPRTPASVRRRAQHVRAVGRDDDRAHDRQLRLSDRAARDAEGHVGAGDTHRRAVMDERATASRGAIRGSAGASSGSCVLTVGALPGRIRRAAVRACAISRRAGSGSRFAAPRACPRIGAPRRVARPRKASTERRARCRRWRARGSSDAVGRGATIAVQQCSMCHGAQGMSEANAPNLAGQYPEVVIKQLQDYKRGDRGGSFMQTLARNLSDRDIDDIASVLRLAAEGAHRACAIRRDVCAGAGSRRRPAAQHCAVHRMPRRHRSQVRRAVARGHAEGVSRRPAQGFPDGQRGATTATRRCAT